MNKIILTEQEVSHIKRVQGISNQKDYVFEGHISANGRYIIIHDEIFDLQEQQSIGNIWESIDNFKTLFRNTIINNEEYKQIRENILSLPILESTQNLYWLKEIIIEGFFDDTWVGKQLKNSGQGIADFAKTSYNGVKQLGVAISQGDWTNILSMLKKGVLYILRSLKNAMYSNLGMIVDAILIATGIGKGAQMVVWALILALDVYQITTNNYPPEEANYPTFAKWLNLGVDALGLVAAGAVAKTAKVSLKPLMDLSKKGNEAAMKSLLKQDTLLVNLLNKIVQATKSVPRLLRQAQTYLAKKFPGGAKFINGIIGKVAWVMEQLSKSINGLLGGYRSATGGLGKAGIGVRSGAEAGAMVYGMDKILGDPVSDDELVDALINYKPSQ